MTITIEEFAAKLDGREYMHEITKEEVKEAENLGFVVVYGASDDLVEFRGAIHDEDGCYGGGDIFIDKNGIFEECKDNCKYSKTAKKNAKVIEAVWCDTENTTWTYQTDIPHATFDIMEDGEVYCRGIVFDIKSLEVVEG